MCRLADSGWLFGRMAIIGRVVVENRLVPFDLLCFPNFRDALDKLIHNRGIKDQTGEQIGERNDFEKMEA